MLEEGKMRTVIGHLRGSYPLEGAAEKSSAQVQWVVEAVRLPTSIRVVASSNTGGTVRSETISLPEITVFDTGK